METVEDFPSFPPGISFTLRHGEGRNSVCEGISTSPAVVGVYEQLLGTTTQEASGLRPCLVPQLNLKRVSRYQSSSNAEELKHSCPRNPSGGRAQRRRRGTCFSCSCYIAFSSAGPFDSVIVRVEMDGAILPTFPPIRKPSFSHPNQATLGSKPRCPFNQVFPPPAGVIIIYSSCP